MLCGAESPLHLKLLTSLPIQDTWMCVERLKKGSLAHNRVSNLAAHKITRMYYLFWQMLFAPRFKLSAPGVEEPV